MRKLLNRGIDKIGAAGAVFAAAACPICFPKLAAFAAIFGLGVLAPFEVYFLAGAHFFVLLSVVGQFIAFRRLKNTILFSSSVIFAALFFISLYVIVWEILSYIALAGIVLGSIWMVAEERKRKTRQLETG